jgi:diaminopimelate decarboxylase
MKKIEKQRNKFLQVAKKKGTPLYIYDSKEASENLSKFKKAFKENKVNVEIFYAIKSNSYLGLLKTITKNNEGLDAASPRELELAIKAKAKKIVYTGPAKSREDFTKILKHSKKIIVNLDSFQELKLLGEMTKKEKIKIKCAIRIYTKSQKGWTKFGIPLEELKPFYTETKKYKYIDFQGLHFHISMNKSPENYIKTLNEIAKYWEKNFTEKEIKTFKFIDIGGGFYPQPFEGIYPWNKNQVMKFFSNETHFKNIFQDKFKERYIPIKSKPIEVFAKEISKIFKAKFLSINPSLKLYAEPGRYISHSTMHFLLKIIDQKNEKMCIVDGGNNMIGWEKYQFFNYVPLFNLSQLDAKKEIPYITYGSLCTPDDIWGYYLHTKNAPKINDILLMAYQGAYTYTLAQNFIKKIPEVHDI